MEVGEVRMSTAVADEDIAKRLEGTVVPPLTLASTAEPVRLADPWSRGRSCTCRVCGKEVVGHDRRWNVRAGAALGRCGR